MSSCQCTTTAKPRAGAGPGRAFCHVTVLLLFLAAAPLAALGNEPPKPPQSPAPAALGLREGVPLPTLGGLQFWSDELLFHQWRIQRNALTGDCRLLDENNFRHAAGTFDQCRAVLESIKRERKLPRMGGKTVIVLHGLADTRLRMTAICDHLHRQGGYEVFNVGYASTRLGIADHAKALASIIAGLDGVEEINFVGYSLGNLVIRHYLADRGKAGGKPDPRFHRMVMIGPPNHGSQVATMLDQSKLVLLTGGAPVRELGHHWAWTETALATPSFPFGIIAGGRGDGRGFNPLLPGDNDGLVTVANARLEGAADFVRVPVMHTVLTVDAAVLQYTLEFLQNGRFQPPRR
jgi:pimeloyl-ACP methyl ester carboxylesterase